MAGHKKGSGLLVADVLSCLVSAHAMQLCAHNHTTQGTTGQGSRLGCTESDAEPCKTCKDPDADDNMVVYDCVLHIPGPLCNFRAFVFSLLAVPHLVS